MADSPDSYSAFQRAEIARWRGVVQATGIKPEQGAVSVAQVLAMIQGAAADVRFDPA